MLHIYKASAGSGKTFALTREYLTLLLGYKDRETGTWHLRDPKSDAHRHILAITFTNKATQEMTRRIISQLAILAGREPQQKPGTVSPYLGDFIKLFNTDADTLARHASDVLDELLADFAFFHVSTIDAFFQNVLRIFAREVEMPDNFRLELDNSATISLGVNEMFTSLNYGTPADPLRRSERQWLSEWLTSQMMRMFESGTSVNILARSSSLYSDLIATFNQLLDETYQINAKIISEYLNEVEKIQAFQKGIEKQTKEAEGYLKEKAIKLKQYGDFDKVNRYIRSRIEQWAKGEMTEPNKTVADAISDPAKRFVAAYYKKGADKGLDELVAEICAEGVNLVNIRNRNDIIIDAITPLGLLGCLLRHITTYCKDNNVILLSNTNSLLREIINDDETPFVYERLGYYLRHFLIDEVQDTSQMQWDNLKPLVMESMGNSNDNLVIGDEKQCIYRFRNSDPNLLGHIISDNVTDIYGDDSVAVEGNTIEQNNNWRSSAEVVKFNNSIFHAMAEASGAGNVYSNVIQQISDKRKGDVPGYVKMIFEPETDSKNDTTDGDNGKETFGDSKSGRADGKTGNHRVESDTSGGEGNADAEESGDIDFALYHTVNEVDRLLKAGYRPGQIAILVRKHSEGEAVINALMHCHEDAEWEHGPIEVKSTDAVGINSSAAVKMIIEILRLTQLPHKVITIRESRDGTKVEQTEENPAFRRARLMYCYQYYLNTTKTDAAGNTRQCTNAEALSLAISAIKRDEKGEPVEGDGTTTPPPGTATLKEIIEFATSATSGTDDDGSGTVTCLTLNAIVDKIISRYVTADVLRQETAYLTAFQDLVYDFCSQSSSDIRSFLAWWDRGGCRSSLSSTSESDALNVMTIHQSKGLEFPCVIIPFANTKMVTFSNRFQLSYHWMKINPGDFAPINPDVVPPMIPVEFTSKVPEVAMFKDEAERIIREQLVDSLNVTYVAFTRAVNELIVIAPKSGKRAANDKRVPTLDAMLRNAVESLTEEAISGDRTLDDGSRKWVLPLADKLHDNIVEIGTPTEPPAAKEKEPEMPVIQLPDYDPAVNDALVTLSEADIDLFDFSDPRHRGNFLHRVLSKVRRPGDLHQALRRAAIRARLSAKDVAECEKLLSKAINDEQVKRWFEGYRCVYLEQSIANSGIDRRPDRIVELPDGSIEIIDYKFGDDHQSYTAQVRRYIALMRQAGYKTVRGYLWFVPEGTIREVK